ncbi:hypothetical protein Val02_82770 [Virgisporangium aliadipatigenens]|uniref:DUF6892 domain-containing protein n=1 Tax=Virgisporangium aliadipatigenens TaxID=741659 RepID=A0A8J3YTS4_9ACTN|nr:hypothetical protein [Virgisporangium aliadipatigenens]GIJ51391.1 hypothetical protein Val02_82770 [Virgisporangium aliadipatigenens]
MSAELVTFPDRGLHLAVVGALLENGVLSRADIAVGIGNPPGEGWDKLSPAVNGLHALALPADAVARVEVIQFDGGSDIYMLIEEILDAYTGGESDDYELRSLAGIDALAAMRELSLDGHGYHPDPLDLSPLRGHPVLASVVLTGECHAASVLETLPALASLDVGLARLDDPDVLVRLAARGVEITD